MHARALRRKARGACRCRSSAGTQRARIAVGFQPAELGVVVDDRVELQAPHLGQVGGVIRAAFNTTMR